MGAGVSQDRQRKEAELRLDAMISDPLLDHLRHCADAADSRPKTKSKTKRELTSLVEERASEAKDMATALLQYSIESSWHIQDLAREQLILLIKGCSKPRVEGTVDLIIRQIKDQPSTTKEVGLDVLEECLRACPRHRDEETEALLMSLRSATTPCWRTAREKSFGDLPKAFKACPDKAGDIIISLLEGCLNSKNLGGLEALNRLMNVTDNSKQASDLLALATFGTEDADFDVGEELQKQLRKFRIRWSDSAVQITISLFQAASLNSEAKEDVWDLLRGLFARCPKGHEEVIDMFRRMLHFPYSTAMEGTLQNLEMLTETFPSWTKDILAFLLAECSDHVRTSIETPPVMLARLVEVYPDGAEKVLATLFRACDCGDLYQEAKAMHLLTELAQWHPNNVGRIVGTLLRKSVGPNESIRSDAVQCLAELIEIYPHRAKGIYAALMHACNGEYPCTRKAAMSRLPELFRCCPDKADEIYAAAIDACQDNEEFVRQAAVGNLKELIQHCPDKADEIIAVLFQGCQDVTTIVRVHAMQMLADVVDTFPSLAPEAITFFLDGCQIKENYLRNASMRGLAQAVKKHPYQVEEVTEVFLHVSKNSDPYVREPAMSHLGVAAGLCHERAEEITSLLLNECDRPGQDDDHMDNVASQLAQMANMLHEKAETIVVRFLGWSIVRSLHTRRRAASHLAELVTACPAMTNEIVDALIRLCFDEYRIVRIAAIGQVGKTAQACPNEAKKLVMMLLHICASYSRRVSEAAKAEFVESLKACPRIAIRILRKLSEKERQTRFNRRRVE